MEDDYKYQVASDYPECLSRIETLVKPERIKKHGHKKLDISKRYVKYWWHFGVNVQKLYKTINQYDQILVSARITKHLQPTFTPVKNIVFSDQTVVIAFNDYASFAILNSSIFQIWAWKNSSTMGASTLRFSSTDCFETYPFPIFKNEIHRQNLMEMGTKYYLLRTNLLRKLNIGITKLYNNFHSPNLFMDQIVDEMKIDESMATYFISGIIELRKIHKSIDIELIKSYQNLQSIQDDVVNIELNHNFYKMDYLPENDQIRYTIHPDASKNILKGLLQLNHKIHEEVVKAGLWDKKSGNKKSAKSKTKANQVNEGEVGYGGLFG